MLVLDCEFNGHNGQLLSMALVGAEGPYSEFYEVLPYKYEEIVPWVRDNVLTKLNKNPIESVNKFRDSLWNFLRMHPHEIIVADSPADFVYLLQLMHYMDEENKYRYISLNLKMEFVISGEYVSEIPHNALSDAKALRLWYYTQYQDQRKLSRQV